MRVLFVSGGSDRRGVKKKYWSAEVTRKSNALDLETGVFTWKDPKRIALSLKQSAQESGRRKASSFQSAMSMLNFYINRAGKNLPAVRKQVLERVKVELRRLFGKTLLLVGLTVVLTGCGVGKNANIKNINNVMKISSNAFQNNQAIPSKYTCDGENVNPPLQIAEVPAGAKSLALVVDDPDAPVGDWVHWLVWNIEPTTTQIAENSVPAGAVQGKTDFGENQYGGPCPPSGTHRYHFKVYALDTRLDLPAETRKSGLEAVMRGHILDQGMLVGNYSRERG